MLTVKTSNFFFQFFHHLLSSSHKKYLIQFTYFCKLYQNLLINGFCFCDKANLQDYTGNVLNDKVLVSIVTTSGGSVKITSKSTYRGGTNFKQKLQELQSVEKKTTNITPI